MPAAVRGAAAGIALRDEGFGFSCRVGYGRHWAAMATVPASGIGTISAGTGLAAAPVPARTSGSHGVRPCDLRSAVAQFVCSTCEIRSSSEERISFTVLMNSNNVSTRGRRRGENITISLSGASCCSRSLNWSN